MLHAVGHCSSMATVSFLLHMCECKMPNLEFPISPRRHPHITRHPSSSSPSCHKYVMRNRRVLDWSGSAILVILWLLGEKLGETGARPHPYPGRGGRRKKFWLGHNAIVYSNALFLECPSPPHRRNPGENLDESLTNNNG